MIRFFVVIHILELIAIYSLSFAVYFSSFSDLYLLAQCSKGRV